LSPGEYFTLLVVPSDKFCILYLLVLNCKAKLNSG